MRKRNLLWIFLAVFLTSSCDQISQFFGKKKENVPQQQAVPVQRVDQGYSGTKYLYYENGQVKAERAYKNDKLSGPYKTYYKSGQLKLEGSYKNDLMDGVFKHYKEDGSLDSQEIYKDNILIKRETFSS